MQVAIERNETTAEQRRHALPPVVARDRVDRRARHDPARKLDARLFTLYRRKHERAVLDRAQPDAAGRARDRWPLAQAHQLDALDERIVEVGVPDHEPLA